MDNFTTLMHETLLVEKDIRARNKKLKSFKGADEIFKAFSRGLVKFGDKVQIDDGYTQDVVTIVPGEEDPKQPMIESVLVEKDVFRPVSDKDAKKRDLVSLSTKMKDAKTLSIHQVTSGWSGDKIRSFLRQQLPSLVSEVNLSKGQFDNILNKKLVDTFRWEKTVTNFYTTKVNGKDALLYDILFVNNIADTIFGLYFWSTSN